MNLLQFRKLIPDEDAALAFVRQARWPDGIVCPFCGCTSIIGLNQHGKRRCRNLTCRRRFTERTGTLFKYSHISTREVLIGMFLFVSNRRALTSIDLSRYLSISQTSGHRHLKFFRQACQINSRELPDTVDLEMIDLDGKKKNMHLGRWSHRKRMRRFEQVVMGVFDQQDRLIHFGVSSQEAGESVLEVLVSMLEPGVVSECRTAHVLGEVNTWNISGLARLWRRIFLSVQMDWGHQFAQNHLDEVAFRIHTGLMERSHLEAMHAMLLNSTRVHKPKTKSTIRSEQLADKGVGV